MLFAVVPPAISGSMAQGTAAAGAGVDHRLRFTFDNGESLKAATQVRDATGNGRSGTVRVSGNGRLTVLRNGVTGRAAGFPRACIGCGRAIIVVPPAPALNPGTRPFSFGASVRATAKQAPPGRDPNIMMKGSTGSLGGKWKLHLIGAKPRCVFQGAASRIELTATRPIDDGTWHRIVCSRNGKLHQLLVDGKVKASSAKAYSGKNVSAQPVKIGGRAVGSNGMNDQFHGDLDGVFLNVVTASQRSGRSHHCQARSPAPRWLWIPDRSRCACWPLGLHFRRWERPCPLITSDASGTPCR
jgi:hypothetical protein